MPLSKSAFWIPDQFRSPYLSESVRTALRLVRECNSISRSSVSFYLSVSRIAPSSVLELDAISPPWLMICSDISCLLLSEYHTPMPAFAFSQPMLIADPSVLITAHPLLRSGLSSILAGSSPLGKGPFLSICGQGTFQRSLSPYYR